MRIRPPGVFYWGGGATPGLDSGNSGLESLSTVTVQDVSSSPLFNYDYDAFQRRRLKAYPTNGGAGGLLGGQGSGPCSRAPTWRRGSGGRPWGIRGCRRR